MPSITVTATVTDRTGGQASATATAQIAAPAAATALGFNLSSGIFLDGVPEPEKQGHDRLLATYGLAQLPAAKVFYGPLPATWNPAKEGAVSGRRVQICYTGNSTPVNAAAGDTDARLAQHAASVPHGWHVAYTPYQEPEDNLTAVQLEAVFDRHHPIVHAAVKSPGPAGVGNRLELWSAFQAPFQTGMSLQQAIDWQPTKADLRAWQVYLNPFGVKGPTGEVTYGSSYDPWIDVRMATAVEVLRAFGGARTAVTEFGGPWRTWDTGMTQRASKLLSAIDWLLAGYTHAGRTIPFEWILPFNARGTKWDQRIRAAGQPATFVQGDPGAGILNEPYQTGLAQRIKGNRYAAFNGSV